jgi:hypothetical protein
MLCPLPACLGDLSDEHVRQQSGYPAAVVVSGKLSRQETSSSSVVGSDNKVQQYRGVSSGQAPSCHSEPKGRGPLKLCLFIICICTSVHSNSHYSSCRSHFKGPTIWAAACVLLQLY